MTIDDIAKAKALMQTIMADAGADPMGQHYDWDIWHIDVLQEQAKRADKPVSVAFGRRHCCIAINYIKQLRIEEFGPGQAEAFKAIISTINTHKHNV